jgi:Ca2+-binding RTX toxin-like protein
MKRMLKLIPAVAVVLMLGAGAAFAATISGTSKGDTLNGSKGPDTMSGRAGNDTIRGFSGKDTIRGGIGNDTIEGGLQQDKIYGGPGVDVIDGDHGADFINVAGDGRADSVSCGVGVDTAIVDAADVGSQSQEDFIRLSSCENVTIR